MDDFTSEYMNRKIAESTRKLREVRTSYAGLMTEFGRKNDIDVSNADFQKLNDVMQIIQLNRIADALEVLAFGKMVYHDE